MASVDERIEQTKKKLAQLKKAKEKQEARMLTAMFKGHRTEDTRRKILAGSLVLDMMERDEQTRIKFRERLDKYLIRADDRALFELPARPE